MKIDFKRSSQNRYGLERILHFLPYPFLISELRNGIRCNIFVNKKFTDEIGYSCDDIPTIQDWFQVAYPDPYYRAEVVAAWEEKARVAALSGFDYAVMKAQIQTRRLGKVWYEVKASVSEQNHLVAFINIDDILRKEAELNLQHENKNKMLSILSHDLRSPLTSLLSLSQLAQNSKLTPEEFQDTLRTVNRKTAQALELLDSTLNWTRTNFESIQVRPETIHLKEIIDNVLTLYEGTIREKETVVVVNEIDQVNVYTDREILTIMLRNIISNAIKFTPPKGLITIGCIRHAGGKTVFVTDTGIGMNSEQLKSIQSGAVISREGTHKEKGIGIGLRFCIELAGRIGAGFEITSSPAGTRVSITLPPGGD